MVFIAWCYISKTTHGRFTPISFRLFFRPPNGEVIVYHPVVVLLDKGFEVGLHGSGGVRELADQINIQAPVSFEIKQARRTVAIKL